MELRSSRKSFNVSENLPDDDRGNRTKSNHEVVPRRFDVAERNRHGRDAKPFGVLQLVGNDTHRDLIGFSRLPGFDQVLDMVLQLGRQENEAVSFSFTMPS